MNCWFADLDDSWFAACEFIIGLNCSLMPLSCGRTLLALYDDEDDLHFLL